MKKVTSSGCREKWPAILLFWLIASGIVLAQGGAARYLNWEPSVVSKSMGGVGVAIHDDALAGYYNPASLTGNKKLVDLYVGYFQPQPLFDGTDQLYLAGAINTPVGAIGLTANLVWKGIQAQTAGDGAAFGSTAEKNMLNYHYKLSYAVKATEQLSLGASLGYAKSVLADIQVSAEQGIGDATSVLFDLGALYHDLLPGATATPQSEPLSGWLAKFADVQDLGGIDIGIALLNAGTGFAFIDEAQKDPAPTRLVAGASWWLLASNPASLMIASDLENQFHDDNTLDYWHIGSQLRLYHLVSLRYGRYIDLTDLRPSFNTYGVAVHSQYLTFNMAREKRRFLSSWLFDLSIHWKGKK